MKIFFALTIFTVATLATGQDDFQEISSENLYPLKLGQFAARQMSTKAEQFKLMQILHTEKKDKLYKLKLQLQRNGDKNNIMYCTVEIQTDKSELTLNNYGCTLPALVRRRRPQVHRGEIPQESPITEQISTTTRAPNPTTEQYDILSYPYENTVNRQINEDESSMNEIDSEPKQKPKRHVVYVRHPIRVAIPARSVSYWSNYQTQPHYQVASKPIVYRLQPQYQPYYQPYYRSVVY